MKWGGKRIDHEHRKRRTKEKEEGSLLSLESSSLSNVWNDTGRMEWKYDFYMYMFMSPSMQKDVCQHFVAERLQRIPQGPTHRDKYWQTDSQCITTDVAWRTRNPLRYCPVTVDILDSRYMIVMSTTLDSLDSILGWGRIFTRRNLAHSRSSRRRRIRTWKETTRNWRWTSAFGALLQHEDQTDHDAVSRVTDHLEGLGKLHTKDPIHPFCSKKRINPIIGERCNDVLSLLSSATSITVTTRDVDVRLHRTLGKIRCAQKNTMESAQG